MSHASVAIRARPWWVEVRAKALEDRPEGLEDRAEALEDFKRSELPSSSEAIFKRSDLTPHTHSTLGGRRSGRGFCTWFAL